MISPEQFIRQSLELNLFFLRIMKEHSFFLEAGFTSKDANRAQEADNFKNVFAGLLAENIALSNGVVGGGVLSSGEVKTGFTLEAEKATEFYTGVTLYTDLTKQESSIVPCSRPVASPELEQAVASLNSRILQALDGLISYKVRLLDDVLSCRIYTTNYPLLIDHIMREARLYRRMLTRLQNRIEFNIAEEAIEQESFWNRIMAEHAKFIRGLLDPTEGALISMADNFGKQFDRLTRESIEMQDSIRNLTNRNLAATIEIRNFKATGTSGILGCSIKSIIIPLLGDHTLREANHYLRLLHIFNNEL